MTTPTPVLIPNAAQVQLALDVLDMSYQAPETHALPVNAAYQTLARALGEPGWTGCADQVEAYGSTRHVTESVLEKARAFDDIAEVLYPGGNLDHEWQSDTIEEVAVHVRPFLEARK